MLQHIWNSRRWCFPLIIIVLIVWYYLTFDSLKTSTLSTLSSSLSTLPPPLSTLPPQEYRAVEMNDRSPSFKLATTDGNKPYADGDRAQTAIVSSLELVTKCKENPSFIVVDIGAFLGNLIFPFYR